MNFPKIIALAFAVMLALASCGPGDRVEITESARRSPDRGPVKLNASSAERFRFALSQNSMSASAGGQEEPRYHWTAPEDWQELPATQYRIANFLFGTNLDGECYLSVLPGGAGGSFANANRWRGQMGLEPYTQEEFDGLPTASILGQPAILVEFDGAYSGMSQDSAKEGFRLKGAFLEHQGSSIFVKMVGPADIVEEAKAQFMAFVRSIHAPTDGHSHGSSSGSQVQPATGALPEGHPPLDGNGVSAADVASNGDFTWETPEGWTQGPPRAMRLATFIFGSQGEGECFVTVLGPGAGGMVMNLNRWRNQFELAPLTHDEIYALPKVELLGEEVPILEASGAFGGMSGEKHEGQALLGVARFLSAKSVFIKMTGPEGLVRMQKENFRAFCESLQAR